MGCGIVVADAGFRGIPRSSRRHPLAQRQREIVMGAAFWLKPDRIPVGLDRLINLPLLTNATPGCCEWRQTPVARSTRLDIPEWFIESPCAARESPSAW